MIFRKCHSHMWYHNLTPLSNILQNLLRRSRNLLRSCSGECLGSSSDEERSELRYSIWIAEFRELIDLWTHAASWPRSVCSFTGVFNSIFRHGSFHGVARSTGCFSRRSGVSNDSEGSSSVPMRVTRDIAQCSGHPQLVFLRKSLWAPCQRLACACYIDVTSSFIPWPGLTEVTLWI